ncbi:MAG: class I SAM-dependent methyltransferase [Gammaproteobacteria bacterium]
MKKDSDELEDFARHILHVCDALLLLVEKETPRRIRDGLVKLIKEGLPLIVYDTPDLAHRPESKRLKLCANTNRFFPFDYYLFIAPDEMLSGGLKDDLKKELGTNPDRKQWCIRYADEPPNFPSYGNRGIEFDASGLERRTGKILSRRQVEEIYYAITACDTDFEAPSTASSTLKSFVIRRIDKTLKANFRFSLARYSKKIHQTINRTKAVASPFPFDTASGIRLPKTADNIAPERPDSGIFNASFHAQNFYLDLPPFRHLADKYSPKSVLDIGCGLGGYLRAFQAWGAADVLGIDGFEQTDGFLCRGAYRQSDLRGVLNLNRRFDLVVCVEVIEHIDPAFESTVLESIDRHGNDLILFSAARVNQPGAGHINCRPIEYWVMKWRELGWRVNIFDTLAVRSLGTFHWFRRNLLVLRRADRVSENSGIYDETDLASVEAERAKWSNQPAAVHLYPLTDRIPPLTESLEN